MNSHPRKLIDRLSVGFNRFLALIGGIFLVAMIVLTCANILFRIIWVPVPGTFELMGFFGALVASFALGYTQIRKGHIAVDVLITTFSPIVQRILAAVNSLICMAFFGLAAWQVGKKATVLMRTGEVTETLRIGYYPFTYGVAVGCGALALVFAADLIQVLFPEKRPETEAAS